MSSDVELTALEGTNPLGFLAALGVVDALDRAGHQATLRWTDDVVPAAVIGGASGHDDLVAVLDRDRERWLSSVVLHWPPEAPLNDAKPRARQLHEWFECAAALPDDQRRESDLLAAIVAEGALDNNDNAKPTHLHFTAGQQRFLAMVRELLARLDAERIIEALFGPWRYDSTLPSLSWDCRGERIYALRATDPSKEKRLGVPAADWLAFVGLSFYPVAEARGRLVTTGCAPEWKRSAFRWPLWWRAIDRWTIASLVADPALVGNTNQRQLERWRLEQRGVTRVLESAIRRTDQGGYGSFGSPDVLAEAPVPAHL